MCASGITNIAIVIWLILEKYEKGNKSKGIFIEGKSKESNIDCEGKEIIIVGSRYFFDMQ